MFVLSDTLDFDQIMVKTPHYDRPLIVVREQGAFYAYINRCPHIGVPLDYGDGRCLAEPGYLLCTLHGARFASASGLCTEGPCIGDHLESVAVAVQDGKVVLP